MIRTVKAIPQRLLERILAQPVLVLLILVVAMVILAALRELGLYVFGLIFAVIVAIIGMACISIYLFRRNEKSLPIFLFDILWVMFYTLLAFSLLYTYPSTDADYFLVDRVRQNLTFSEAFYFSAVTFATVGYGDILPHGDFRGYAVTEALLGMILFGLFVSAVAKLSYEKK